MERVQRAHLGHRDRVEAELARLNDVEQSPLAPLVNASTGAARGRDRNIEGQERP